MSGSAINPLEVLADAIMREEGWYPRTRAWRNRNPGNLRPTSADEPSDGNDYRVFDSFVDGYTALLGDLADKFTGRNKHGLGPDSRLVDLIDVWAPSLDHNDPNQYCKNVSAFMTLGLQRQIAPATLLGEIWKEE